MVIGIRPHAIPTVRFASRVNGNWAWDNLDVSRSKVLPWNAIQEALPPATEKAEPTEKHFHAEHGNERKTHNS
ncbi:MAG: hypothetical protein WBA41_05100 [Rivularia sp. (in: cyanobacteria)]